MVDRNAQDLLLAELALLLEPLVEGAGDPTRLAVLFQSLGWDLETMLGANTGPFLNKVAAIATAVEQVRGWTGSGAPDTLEELADALGTVAAAVAAIRTLPADIQGVQPAALAALPSELLGALFLRYVYRRSPRVYRLLDLLTVIGHGETGEVLGTDGSIVRAPAALPRADLARLPLLLQDPVGTLKQAYLPNGLATQRDADDAARRMFPLVAEWLEAIGLEAAVGRGSSPRQLSRAREEALAGVLTAWWRTAGAIGGTGIAGELGASAKLIPAAAGGPGVFVAPFGTVDLTHAFGTWLLRFRVTPELGAFLARPTGVELVTNAAAGGPLGHADLTLILAKLSPDAPAFLVGSASATRLEIGEFRITAQASLDAVSQEYGALIEAGSGAIVVAAGDSDGFLQQVLPPEGVRTAFDLALGWSSRNGVYFRGSAGLEATLPINQDLAGVLRVNSVYLALRPDGGAIRAALAATVSVQLGPVAAAVERFGLQATLTFPAAGGNLGPAELALTFKPPNGAGLKIDAGVVVGGGYLFFDPEREQYAGVVLLEIAEKLSLTAFGLLTTRMPDGSPGFSLLVLMAAKFSPPVQLGYGFTLNGVGGLLGVNRTVSVPALRAGLRAGALGSVLFPEDPVRNAPQIISDLNAIFPPAAGRFVFGPMAILGWGTPTLLTLELGLLLELPAPVRLFILGRLRVLLPEEKHPVVRLQLDALGIIDFESGDVSLDAVLYDSLVAQFAVTGEMALRANFGSNPGFVLAVGGFSPRYPAPQGFPLLERVAISLATGDSDDLRLRLEAYLALTTNTVQFGARLELYARAGGFSIEGYLGFDALVQFDPFGFIVDLGADVALKRGSSVLMSVSVQMTLTGPTPWHAWGRASFKVLFISASVHFDVQFGEPEPPPLPPPVRVRPLLLAALRERGNWATQLPPGEHPIVSLREQPAAAETLVHPLALFQVSQRVVPLGREITRFGNTVPDGERRFTLGVVGADGRVLTPAEAGMVLVDEFFAPAQFREMSDDEKLAAPAFERLPAGISFAVRGYRHGEAVEETSMEYEEETLLAPASRPAAAAPAAVSGLAVRVTDGAVAVEEAPYVVANTLVEQVAASGAAGLAPMTQTGAAKYAAAGAVVRGFGLRPPSFAAVAGIGTAATLVTVVDPASTAPARPGQTDGAAGTVATTSGDSGALSYMAAMEALSQQAAAFPAAGGQLRVVPYLAEVAQ